MQAPPRRASGPAYSPLQSPLCGGELSVPSSPPATPPRSSQKIRAGQRSPTRGLQSPTVLRPQGESRVYTVLAQSQGCLLLKAQTI